MKINKKRKRERERYCSEPRHVYNPKKLRWEYQDGTPVEEPKPKPRTLADFGPKDPYRKRDSPPRRVRTMPFGQYKDHGLDDIPTDYLRWVLENVTDNGSGLIQAVEEEYRKRNDD